MPFGQDDQLIGREDQENNKYSVTFSLRRIPIVNKFVSREGDMIQLEDVLVPRPGPNIRRKIFVLYGLGGIGKTQLAVEFARNNKKKFSACFWLDGSTRDNIRQSIANVASQIPETQISKESRNFTGAAGDLDAVIEEVLRWFSLPENSRWLLVIDNVDRAYPSTNGDSDAFDVEKFFPDTDHGSILITSRLKELEQLGSSHKLKGMDENQGRKLIESRVGKVLEGSSGLAILRQS